MTVCASMNEVEGGREGERAGESRGGGVCNMIDYRIHTLSNGGIERGYPRATNISSVIFLAPPQHTDNALIQHSQHPQHHDSPNKPNHNINLLL